LITAQSYAFWRKYRAGVKFLLRIAAAGVLILVLIGFDPDADVVAHVGGFIAGAVFGAALGHAQPQTLQRGAANLLSFAALAALLVATWRLALRGQ